MTKFESPKESRLLKTNIIQALKSLGTIWTSLRNSRRSSGYARFDIRRYASCSVRRLTWRLPDDDV